MPREKFGPDIANADVGFTRAGGRQVFAEESDRHRQAELSLPALQVFRRMCICGFVGSAVHVQVSLMITGQIQRVEIELGLQHGLFTDGAAHTLAAERAEKRRLTDIHRDEPQLG